MKAKIQNFFSFVKNSPSPFHVVKNISEILLQNGFLELSEGEKWNLSEGKSYFLARNSSSIIAFRIPKENASSPHKFLITASHSDSPVFKIKENPEIHSNGCVVLNVEKYGGMLIQPWFDRPLSVAGRIVVRDEQNLPSLKEILVHIDRDLLLIPNLAIHMNRDANEGKKIDIQTEIRPVFSLEKEEKLLNLVAKSAGVAENAIIAHDLFLYNRTEPALWGAKNEFISAPKIDDLECVYTTLQGFLKNDSESSIPVYCVFDNEEVGSSSRQGADSTFLNDTLERISEKLQWSKEDYKIALSKSFMISADNAHAFHPNYASAADPVNRPKVNGGIVLKFNAAQKYTTDALSAAYFKEICRKAGVPLQIYTNNSNIAGGSTLGNISQNHVSIQCVDIGLAQWAMHSPYETAGAQDIEFMEKAITEFYQYHF
mgnify:CR=1 FL=1